MSIPMVRLLYTSAAITDFPIKEILTGTRRLTPDDYLLSLSVPMVEMLTKDPVNMIEELIAMTSEQDWKERLRRTPVCGDIMRYGNEHWMLVKKSDLKHLMISEKGFVVLPERKTYAIVHIPESQIDGDICDLQLQTT